MFADWRSLLRRSPCHVLGMGVERAPVPCVAPHVRTIQTLAGPRCLAKMASLDIVIETGVPMEGCSLVREVTSALRENKNVVLCDVMASKCQEFRVVVRSELSPPGVLDVVPVGEHLHEGPLQHFHHAVDT